MTIEDKYRELLKEAVSDLLYDTSLKLAKMKGKPLDSERKRLTKKQALLEELQSKIYTQ